MFKEFKAFIAQGNVLDLAVAMVLGLAFKDIVSSFVSDVIMPPIGLLLGGIDFSNIFISLDGTAYESLAAAQEAGAATINIGVFLNTIITFIIIAFALFIAVRNINRFKKKEEAKAPEPTAEQKLLAEIRDVLKKK